MIIASSALAYAPRLLPSRIQRAPMELLLNIYLMTRSIESQLLQHTSLRLSTFVRSSFSSIRILIGFSGYQGKIKCSNINPG